MLINIRLAKPADALEMAEIHSRSWEMAYKEIIPMEYIKEKNATRPALFKRIITDDNDRQYVIEADGAMVGIMCVAKPQEDSVEIMGDTGIDDSFYELHGIYLHPDVYRKGIGTVAMEFAIKKAQEAGKTNMILWVFAENLNTIRFDEGCGFNADGASKIYNCGKEMQCIRMRRKI